MSNDIPVVILAGGLASRMGGGDKCLLELAPGHRILDEVLVRLRPQSGHLALNANGDPARFAGLGLPVLADSRDDRPGPLAGVLVAMAHARALGARHVVTAAGDTPFVPQDLVARLRTATEAIAIAASRDDEGVLQRHPVFGLWPVDLHDDLAAALDQGVRKVMQWAKPHGVSLVEFPHAAGRDPFFNINTPGDLDLARQG